MAYRRAARTWNSPRTSEPSPGPTGRADRFLGSSNPASTSVGSLHADQPSWPSTRPRTATCCRLARGVNGQGAGIDSADSTRTHSPRASTS
ncbi:hypothetical protein FHR32_006078 [Streptosporangium album]|uniref:Uncharacterized protein n=1 Tax=Streptosporangium album TaxID=47479 RepID=A0A7W7WC46_9ACTN|nr:hypothetical protein [Streptosporangium album]MBB4941701.1 hypothetical protein [Streptosporangium album]